MNIYERFGKTPPHRSAGEFCHGPRDSRDNGECAEMRGVAGVIIPRARIAWTRAFCQNARGWFRVVFLGEAEMARRMIFVLTLGVLIGLASAPAWRWLERSLYESLPVYSQLPDFELVDALGRKFTRERLSGKSLGGGLHLHAV